jgi:hypothetical protein
MIVTNLVIPKAAAKRELLFNKQASEAGLLNKSSCLARTLGVTKFMNIRDMIWVALCCATEVKLVQQTHLSCYIVWLGLNVLYIGFDTSP